MKQVARWLFYLIVLGLPMYYWRFDLLGIPTNLIEVLVLLAVLMALPSIPWRRWYGEKLLLTSVALIFAGLMFGILASTDKTAALGVIKSYFIIPVMFFTVFAATFDKKDLKTLRLLIGINITFISVYALLAWLKIFPPIINPHFDYGSYLEQHRAVGFFESPNYLAMYLVPLWLVFYAIARSSLWRSAVSFLICLAVIATLSRSGITALLVGSVLLVNLRLQTNRKVILVNAGLAGLLVTSLALATRATDSIRLHIWGTAVKLIEGHWLFGIGPGQFQTRFTELNQGQTWLTTDVATTAYHPHNLFLAIWLSAGLFGLIGFGLLLYFIFRKLVKCKEKALIVWPAIVAIIVHGLFDTTYFKNDLAIVFWMLVALTIIIDDQESS